MGDAEAGSSPEPSGRPAVAVVMAVMWLGPAVVVGYWAVDYLHRAALDPTADKLAQSVALVAITGFFVVVAIGTWRLRSWAWWMAMLVVASGLIVGLVVLAWAVFVGVWSAVSPPPPERDNLGPLVALVYGSASVLLIGLCLPMLLLLRGRRCRRAFRTPKQGGEAASSSRSTPPTQS